MKTLKTKLENFVLNILEGRYLNFILKKLNIFIYIKFFKNFIKKIVLILLDFFVTFKTKDYLWLYAKRRFFLSKIKHFFLLIFVSYYVSSYFYDIYYRRNWISRNFSLHAINKKNWDKMIMTDFYLNSVQIENAPLEPLYSFNNENFQLSHMFDMWLHVISFILIINFFFLFRFFLKQCMKFFTQEIQ